MKVELPRPQFETAAKLISCLELTEDKCRGFIRYQNRLIVITGGMGDGQGKGWAVIWGTEAIPLSSYKGKYKPASYSQTIDEVRESKRPRGYHGQKIRHQGSYFVLTGEEFRFSPIETGIQKTIF